jgi:uncharacterized Tic20 family protein
MPADNVTPFRRPPPKPVRPQQQGWGLKTHRGKAVLVHVLTIACFVVPFVLPLGGIERFVGMGLGIAAGVIAYTSREGATPWAATHHEQALRTIVFAFVFTTLLSLPGLVIPRSATDIMVWYSLIMFWGSIVVLIWAGIRALVGLVLAGMRKPVFNARGWLV